MVVYDKLTHKKVAIYIRVSTHWQVDKDSLHVQRRELIAYAEMVLGISDYVVFEDPGYSAKNTDRPDYQAMMDRLRTGEFSHLLVWKIDRISRNLLDFANMYEELKRLGVTFVSKNEQFDTSSAIGEAMLKIILIFAELERKITAERVTAVMISRANVGDWNGGRVPYGYCYNKQEKTFSIHTEESKLVKFIYEFYIEHQSIIQTVRYLNEHNYTTRAGKQWSTNGVYKILTNVWYIGSYRYNVHKEGERFELKEEAEWITVDNHHEALVSQELFERVKFLLTRNRRGGVAEGKTYERKNVHIFGGLVRCGSCGSLMTSSLDKRRADGWRPSLYGCSKRRKSIECTNKYTSDAYLGPFIFNYISNIIRAKETTSQRTDLATLERKLLRGEEFVNVKHIGTDELQQLKELLISGVTGFEFNPANVTKPTLDDSSEYEALMDKKRIHEKAMNRLQALYLYGEDDIAEKDFIIERKRIMSAIDDIDKKLASLKKSDLPLESEEFIEKASYFILVEKLLDDRYVDYRKYIRELDPQIPKAFVKCVINKIYVTDGNITKIEFRNGMTHHFEYTEA